MKYSQSTSEVYVWNAVPPEAALKKTTHMGICAHHDDLEILALHGILECFHQANRGFTGVVVTDGAGSARDFEYAEYSDAAMKEVRRLEQKKAAFVGEYTAQVLLDHPSKVVKDSSDEAVVVDLANVLRLARPEVLYTHNLCDRHDTHVAVALRTLAALRLLAPEERPKKVIGCEVWRDLDWLPESLKVVMDVSAHENLQAALLGVFDSQIAGGKRYDLAALGRRKAHATFSESHGVDRARGLIYGMDLTGLMNDRAKSPAEFARELCESLKYEVSARLEKLA